MWASGDLSRESYKHCDLTTVPCDLSTEKGRRAETAGSHPRTHLVRLRGLCVSRSDSKTLE